jgi:anti-sigma factor RsiW
MLQKWISVHLDGELDDARTRTVRDHLSSCDSCRAFAADLGRLGDTLNAHTVSDAQPGFAGRVMSRLANERPGNISIDWLDFWRPAPVVVAVAAFCIGVGITVAFNVESTPDSSMAQAETPAVGEADLGVQNDADSVETLLLALLPEGGR